MNTTELLEKYGVDPADYKRYLVGSLECWNCKEHTPVFDWVCPEDVMCITKTWEDHEPMNPPPSVRYSHSQQYRGNYWANHCLSCDSLIGSWYLEHSHDIKWLDCRKLAKGAPEDQGV